MKTYHEKLNQATVYVSHEIEASLDSLPDYGLESVPVLLAYSRFSATMIAEWDELPASDRALLLRGLARALTKLADDLDPTSPWWKSILKEKSRLHKKPELTLVT